MSQHTKLRRESLMFWLATYPISIFLGCFVMLLRFTGRLRIIHPERIPKNPSPLIIAPNHPSFWEPIILTMLFFPKSIMHPRVLVPWCTPDRKNFTDRWWKRRSADVLGPRFIFVKRETDRGRVQALVAMRKVLERGERLILFPEGGRTYKGDTFRYSPKGTHRVRAFKGGLGILVHQTGASVLPVWVHGSDRVMPNHGRKYPRLWRPVTLVIGEVQRFRELTDDEAGRDVVNSVIAQQLLVLADEISEPPVN